MFENKFLNKLFASLMVVLVIGVVATEIIFSPGRDTSIPITNATDGEHTFTYRDEVCTIGGVFGSKVYFLGFTGYGSAANPNVLVLGLYDQNESIANSKGMVPIFIQDVYDGRMFSLLGVTFKILAHTDDTVTLEWDLEK